MVAGRRHFLSVADTGHRSRFALTIRPRRIDDQTAAQGQTCYIINTSVKDFRAVATEMAVSEEQQVAVLSRQAAAALNINEGDAVRFAPVKFRD